MEMAFIALVGLFIYGYAAYEKIEHWRYVRKFHPEHIRDRSKELQVGQIWTDSIGTTRTITAISNYHVAYDLYYPPTIPTGGWTREVTKSQREFRNEIREAELHLMEQ